MSEVKVNKISPRSGTNVTLGDSGDTISIPTGVTLDASNATTTLPSNIVTTDGTQTLTNKSIATTQLTGTITPSDNTVSLAKLTATGTKDSTTFLRGDNTFAEAGGGKVLQVKQSVVTNRQSGSGGFNDITGLSVSITPSATSSKILVMGSLSANSIDQYVFARFMRDTTAIGISDSNGSNARATMGNFFISDNNNWQTYSNTFLDSPSTTSAITYKIQIRCESFTYYINYGGKVSTVSSRGNGISTITVMEIGA